jgi:hypothetical protein
VILEITHQKTRQLHEVVDSCPVTTRAGYERGSGLGLDMDRGRAGLMTLKGDVTLQVYIEINKHR